MFIEDGDLKINLVGDKKGGQHVGSMPTKVRVEHIPTGVIAICGVKRTQHENRRIAEKMIEIAINNI